MLPDKIKLVTSAFRLLPTSIRILEKFTSPTRILRLKENPEIQLLSSEPTVRQTPHLGREPARYMCQQLGDTP